MNNLILGLLTRGNVIQAPDEYNVADTSPERMTGSTVRVTL